MVRGIIWNRAALVDLAGIKDYVARDSRESASRVVHALEQAADRLVDFPFAARVVPEFNDPSRRDIFVYQYRLMYRVEDDCIYILRVVHGRRLLRNVPGSFEETAQAGYRAA